MNTNTRSTNSVSLTARKTAFIGIFGAIGAVLMFLEFPLFFAPSFYQLDFSEVPVLIGAFAYGPVTGILIELIKSLIHFLIKGSMTAGVGEIAAFVIGISMVLPASIIYRMGKTKKRAVIGMIAGVACMTVTGCLLNAFVLLPAYGKAFGMPIDSLIEMGTAVNSAVHNLFTFAVFCVAPFNLFKGIAVSLITFLLYKHISGLIKNAEH